MTSLVLRRSLAIAPVTAVLLTLAAPEAWAEPAVLYVPTEDVVLNPHFTGGCGGQVNSAGGCTSVDAMEVVPPYADVAAVQAALGTALAAYDVHITDVRPPEYLAYTMLLPGDTPAPSNEGFTCTAGGINCAARLRNGIIRVLGPTQNCLAVDVPLASIYAFGRASGLEGVADVLDAMHYVPNYAMGTGTFVDGCSAIVHQLSYNDMGEQIMLPLECTALDHTGCAAEQQNSHADLLAYFGARTIDVDPPELNNLLPGDGALIAAGEDLVLDVDISDADPVVGGRWTVVSSALEAAGIEDGTLTMCTNDVCFIGFDDATPLKATDSDWRFQLAGLPRGIYEITFEAADFHGNVATPVVMVVEVGEVPSTDSGGWDTGSHGSDSADTGGLDTGGGSFTTAATTMNPNPPDGSGGADVGPAPSDDSGTSGPEADDGMLVEHGCLCTASRSSGSRSGAAGWLLLLVPALARRRAARTRIRARAR